MLYVSQLLSCNIRKSLLYSLQYYLFIFCRFTPGQKSPLHALLKFIKPKLYPNLSKAEGPARRILFIIAESSDFSSEASLVLRARTLKDQRVEVFLLIVGKHVTNSLPNKVASEPFQGHVFQVRSFQDLTRLSRAFTGTGEVFLFYIC